MIATDSAVLSDERPLEPMPTEDRQLVNGPRPACRAMSNHLIG